MCRCVCRAAILLFQALTQYKQRDSLAWSDVSGHQFTAKRRCCGRWGEGAPSLECSANKKMSLGGWFTCGAESPRMEMVRKSQRADPAYADAHAGQSS